MKYVVKHDLYPQLTTYASGTGQRIVFRDFRYATDDADVARELIRQDDIKLVQGRLPNLKKK